MLLPFLSLAALLVPSEAQQAPSPSPPPPTVELAEPVVVRLPVDGDPSLAWVRAATEVGLARLPGVVPLLGDLRPAPGLERPKRGPRYDLQITRASDQVEVSLCRHATCSTWTTPVAPEAPWTVAESIVQSVAKTLERPHVPDALDRTADGYIRGKIETALAHQEGSAADPTDREGAIERAIFLDPSLVVVQWMASRVGAVDDEQQLHLLRRGRLDNDSPVHLASEAWAQQRVGQDQAAARIWRQAMMADPEDARLRLPTAESALSQRDWDTAAAALDGLRSSERVERNRVALADATQPDGATDTQLAAWQAATSSAEPVRRRIELRLEQGDLEGAGALASRLAARGAPERARRLVEAVDANTESGRTPLDQLDDQLARTDAAADEAHAVLDDLAVLQNHLLLELGEDRSCGPATTRRIQRASTLGEEARWAIGQLGDELTVLRDLMNASDVAPVLDPDRLTDRAGLERDHEQHVDAYLAAVDVQSELLEVCP